MDLQFQQMFQRKPNRPPFQPGQNQGPNRPPNMQRPPHIPPPSHRPQNMQYRGNQQQNQYQNFEDNRGRGPRHFGGQGNFDENQGGNRGNFNQGMNRNQDFRNQYQNQSPFQQTSYNQPPQQNLRQPRQYQNRQQRYQDQQPYQRQGDQQDTMNQRRNQQFQRHPFNRNQPREEFIPPPPPQRNPRNQRNEYQNRNDQDVMRNAMNQFFEQEFQSTQGRGRGRSRGRGRPNSYERGENQHQRPFKSEMDKRENKERFQKFKPKPIVQRESPKKSFIKKDDESVSREVSIQSERSYSEDEYSGEDQESRSRSYSGESGEEKSYSEEKRSDQDQDQYSGEEEEAEASEAGEEEEDQSAEQRDVPAKLPSIKSMNDISTNAINDMCSKEEFNERLETFEQNNRDAEHSKLKLDTSRSFSIFEINRRTLKPEYALALKRFKRSAERADGEDEDDTKDCRRSVKALVKVMNHINKEIIDADNMRTKDLAFPLPPGEQAFEFIHIYDFLWDRMREMIKDITRLSQKQKLTKEIITICEQIARFFILSINQGRKKYNSKLKFDERMNIESIIKVISNLMEVYRESRMNLKSLIQGLSDTERQNLTIEKVEALMLLHGIYISPHEPELSAYSFLFSDDRKKEFYRILTAGFEDPQTQSESPLINSDEMQRALAFHRTLNERNIQKYFDQIQNSQTDYVFSCLMLKHLQMMRKETSKMLFKSHYYKDDMTETAQKSAILGETLRQTLRFPQSQSDEFVEFLDMLGVRNQGKLLIWRDGALNEDHYIIPEYIFQHDKTLRKDWSDQECKKNITKPNKLSRQQLIKCSWKKSTYRQQIISFFLGKAIQAKPIKPKIKISKEIPTNQISKQSIEIPKEKERQKQVQDAVSQKEKQAKNLLALNQMRKGLQKKAKRTKFLQKIQTQIHELFKHTDQAKIINRKKALAIMDEWLMYYHDKMLRLSFNMMENEAQKKNLLANMLREMKTYSTINKQFHDSYNKLPYEFEAVNRKNIVPEKAQKGLMSGILSKAHFRAKKVSNDSFEDYLNKTAHSFTNRTLNFMILTTCSSTFQNQKTLYDLMLYFIHQEKGNFTLKKKQLNQAIQKNKTKQKEVPLLKVYFEAHNLTLNLRLAKINQAKSKRKAMTQNSHVIQHLFGCHTLILMRDNSKHVTTQVILQNLEEFVSSKSRIYQDQEKDKIDSLQKIQLPILLINSIKRPSSGSQHQKGITLSKISKQKYPYLANLNEAIVIEGTTDPCSLPFMLHQQIQKQLQNTQNYMLTMNLINAGTHHFDPTFDRDLALEQAITQPFEASLEMRPLKELLREIRVNSSIIEEKLKFKEGDMGSEIKKKFIFSFYQQYFNLCMQQLTQQASSCYKNSIFFKKWPKQLLLTQNVLTQSSFMKQNLHSQTLQKLSEQEEEELITQTLESQHEYNLLTETFKEYEFMMNICQELKMKFVGEHIEPIDAKYLIFDEQGFNVFGMPKKAKKDETPRQEKERVLHLTHFINTIGKYISLFDPNKTLSDEKFQNLYTLFQEHQLQFKIFNLNNLKYDSTENQNNKELQINYQIDGDSLEFFSYIIGYLMEGCKHVNVLLPVNFRFKISIEEFMQQGMRNLNNVINVMNFKKKDIFQNLRHEKIQSLSRLVLQDFTDQNGWGFQTTKDTNNGYNPADNLGYRDYDEFDYINQGDEDIPIDVDRDEELRVGKKPNPFKRDIGYHYRTVYSKLKEELPDPRREFLNELRKQIKCDYE